MYPAVRCYLVEQSCDICGIQFGVLAVFQHVVYYRRVISQFFEYLRVGGITALCLFLCRKSKFFKKNGSKLLRGSYIELVTGFIVYHLLGFLYHLREICAEFLDALAVDTDTGVLHRCKYLGKGEFDVLHKRSHTLGLYLGTEFLNKSLERQKIGKFAVLGVVVNAVLRTELVHSVVGSRRIEQIAAYCRIAPEIFQFAAVCHRKAIVCFCIIRGLFTIRSKKAEYQRFVVCCTDLIAVSDGQYTVSEQIGAFLKTGCYLSCERQLLRCYSFIYCRLFLSWSTLTLTDTYSELVEQFEHFKLGQQFAYAGIVRFFKAVILRNSVNWCVTDDSCQPLALLGRLSSGSKLSLYALCKSGVFIAGIQFLKSTELFYK